MNEFMRQYGLTRDEAISALFSWSCEDETEFDAGWR